MLNQKGVNPTSFDYQISLEQYSNFYASNSLKLTQKQFSFIGLIIFIVKIILCYESQHLYSIFSVTFSIIWSRKFRLPGVYQNVLSGVSRRAM